jgi:hypothetical protein
VRTSVQYIAWQNKHVATISDLVQVHAQVCAFHGGRSGCLQRREQDQLYDDITMVGKVLAKAARRSR